MFECRMCRVGIGIDENQAVGNSVLFARFANAPIAFDLTNGGGNIHVSEAVLLGGGTFVKASGLNSNSGRFDCEYLKIDSDDDPTTIVDLTKEQTHSIRIAGHIGNMAIAKNAAANQRFIEPAGRNTDIELDILGLPKDEAIAWARKPYPIADPTIFHTPDLGLDEHYTPATSDLQVYVDTTDLDTIPNAEEGLAVATLNSKFGAPNHFAQTVADDKPILLLNGIHHRPSLLIDSDVLICDSPSGVSEVGDSFGSFEIRAIVRPENHSGGSGQNIIVGLWNQTGNERSWMLGTDNNYVVQARISTNGSSSTLIEANEPLVNGEPAPIIWRRNATTGEMTLTVNGRTKTETGPTGSLHQSTADLTIGAGHGKAHTFEGDIQHVSVWRRLLTTGAGSEGETHTRHWRRKAGVW
jgi:hypothetical protein